MRAGALRDGIHDAVLPVTIRVSRRPSRSVAPATWPPRSDPDGSRGPHQVGSLGKVAERAEPVHHIRARWA